jgi:alanine dehydrogenase
MHIVGSDEIHRLLDFPSLIDALRAMFRDGCQVPARHHHTIAPVLADGTPATLLVMPAWQAGRALGIKIVTVFPDNTRRSLPAVHGTYLLLDAATGAPSALLDGTALTLRRTAAASALAAGFLARPDSAVHLMVGTGALAPHLVAAHAVARPIRQVRVWGRSPEKAAALARWLAEAGFAAAPVADLEEAVAAADVITCATLAREPLIRGAWLRPGTHLDLVGGFTPDMREADDAAVARARVYVDTDMALREAGDIVQPLLSGRLTRDRIVGDLFGLAGGICPGRGDPAEITLFKSVGTALEDLAAAQLAISRVDAR